MDGWTNGDGWTDRFLSPSPASLPSPWDTTPHTAQVNSRCGPWCFLMCLDIQVHTISSPQSGHFIRLRPLMFTWNTVKSIPMKHMVIPHYIVQKIFLFQFKFEEISFGSSSTSDHHITTNSCTWHDSCAVVTCARVCCDMIVVIA